MPTATQDPVVAVAASLGEIRRTAPLVHNITNYVVMNTTANALLALGASPAMVHAADEVSTSPGPNLLFIRDHCSGQNVAPH